MLRPQFHTSDPVWLANPLNRQHPLARGLLSFVTVLPGRFGGPSAYDLTDGTAFTLGSAATWRDSIQRSGAWNFSGGAGSQILSTAAKFSLSSVSIGKNWSASVWYRTTASTASSYAFMSLGGASSAIIALVSNTTSLSFVTMGTNNAFSGAFKNDGKWHNFTATWNGTTVFGYQDGQLLGSAAQSAAATACAQLIIGSRYSGSFLMNGDIDAPMLWRRPLTPNEVFQVYQEGLRGFPTLLNRVKRSLGKSATVNCLLLHRRRKAALL